MKTFVTVGTTLFESLIDAASEQRFLESCRSLRCSYLLLQIGQGRIPIGITKALVDVAQRDSKGVLSLQEVLSSACSSRPESSDTRTGSDEEGRIDIVFASDGELYIRLGNGGKSVPVGNVVREYIEHIHADDDCSDTFNVYTASTASTTSLDHGLKLVSTISNCFNVRLAWFRFTKDFNRVMDVSDIVISHGGAGSILAALRKQKRLIVVVNTDLMDNHQVEIANAMADGNYAIQATRESLAEDIKVIAKLRVMERTSNISDPDRNFLTVYPKCDRSGLYKVIEEETGVSPIR